MQGLEQRHVPLLNMGEEARASAGMGRGDGDLDEPGPERGGAPEGRGDREARTPPLSGRSGTSWMRTVPTTASTSPPNVERAQIGMARASMASRSSPSNRPCSVQKTCRRRAAQARRSQGATANFTRKWFGR